MNRIKQLRKEKGLTLQQVADGLTASLSEPKFDLQRFAAGGSSKQSRLSKKPIAKSTVLRWENEKNSPTAEMWGLLADYFGVSVDYLQGAWSKKEVLDLISSSLLDNYERIHNMALEYGGDGEEWRFLDEISVDAGDRVLITGSGQVMKFESAPNEKKFIDELRRNYFEGLAFSVLEFVYYRGICHNFHTEEHFDYEARIEADDKLTDAEKEIRLKYKSYPVTKGIENVRRFMMSFWQKRDSEKRLAFLDAFFHEYDDNSILEDVVVNKIMQEKAPAETMALVLTSVIDSATNSFGNAISSEHELYVISRLEQQYKELSKHVDELQKENDRLKAELASK